MALEVHFESIVERPIEVDGEARDAHDGAVHLDELMREFGFNAIASTAHENASGDAEVAVEPRVPEASTMFCTRTCRKSAEVALVLGFRRGQGESVCAPMITNPLPGQYLAPTVNAHTALMLRVKKYFPPGLRWSQESRSEIPAVWKEEARAGMSVTNGRCGRRAAGDGRVAVRRRARKHRAIHGAAQRGVEDNGRGGAVDASARAC